MNDNRDSFAQSSGKERASQSDANKTARRFFSPKIPKKGRIRIAILIVLCLIIIRLLIPHCGGGAQKPQAAPASVVKDSLPKDVLHSVVKPEPAQKQNGHSQPAPFFGIGWFKKPILPHHDFSFYDCATLLKSRAPHLWTPTDTLLTDNKKYVLHYGIDTGIQKTARTLLAQYHPKYGAVVAMESRTGRVLALVSYTRPTVQSYGDNLYVRSMFPAASVFKTVTASAAIECAKVNPETSFPLAGRRYTLYKFQLKESLGASIPVTLREAYAFSINPIFGRIGVYVVGASGLKDYMNRFGFNCPIPFELDNECPVANVKETDSLLAVAEVASGFNQKTKMSPLFGALLAASVCENGRMPSPYIIDSICTGDSNTIYRAGSKTLRVPIKPSTSVYLKAMMAQVALRGTARTGFKYVRHSAFFDDIDFGGKTGTIDDDKLGKTDWFIGFACHPTDPKQRIAVGVVTVHDEYWTVHSSYIAAEIFRKYIRKTQVSQRARIKNSR